jgi:hypothetical protein
MKLRPILFSKSMVQAIRADRKTQTRRAAKGVPDDCQLATADDWNAVRADPRMRPFEAFGPARGMVPVRHADGGIAAYTCPFGAPGDRLWIREAWRVSQAHDPLPPRDIPTDVTVEYLADDTGYFDGRYRHARFMPRWASRLTLEITDVRLQRLKDINHDDAIAEGWPGPSDQTAFPRVWYRFLWEQINGEESWDRDPFTWVISFKRVVVAAAERAA